MNYAIEIDNLSKKFGNFYALNNVSFSVEKGKIYSLLGPNGAGKSTIMKILSTLMYPTSGKVKINNYDVVHNKKKIRPIISLVSDYTVLEDDLTPYENLKMFLDISKRKIDKSFINSLLEDFGLNIYKNRLTKNLSSGNKQKLNIARSLVKNPEILLLDEPTNAIDIETSRFIREYIIEKNVKDNLTVLLSSHYIWEAEQLSSEIIIINEGEIAEKNSIDSLMEKYKNKFNIYELEINNEKDYINLKSQDKINIVKPLSNGKTVISLEENHSYDFSLFKPKKMTPSLEDVYTNIINAHNKKLKQL